MPDVVIYTTSNCPKCKLLKEQLAKLGVSYVEKSLEDTDVAAELILKDVFELTAPILEIGGRIVPQSEIFDGERLLVDKLANVIRGGESG